MVARLFGHLFAALAVLVLSSSVGAVHSFVAANSLDEGDERSNEFIPLGRPLAAGYVLAINRAAGTITIRHEPIPDLFMMETMTMMFRVSDKSMLEGLTPGDKIRFKVQRDDRRFVIVRIENSN